MGILQDQKIEAKLGEYGSASAELTHELKVKIAVGVEVDLVAELKKLAAHTATPIDDVVVAWLEKLALAAGALA